MLKRLTDIVLSSLGLLILSPGLFVIAVVIVATSRGGIFYRQKRVGKNVREFTLYKFRTMRPGSDKSGLLTVGGRDPRITPVGRLLRRYKLDELPQLLNVLNGTMSIVGPRPEVKKYVDLYTVEQRKVLSVRPGITDPASIAYFSENDLLARSSDPEKTYVEEIMPAKLAINMQYIARHDWFGDIRVIILTIARVFGYKAVK
jgi:lipopolysaccharide/colanic/teichoic acid biosynthesis glycosyltransferase